MADNNQKPKEQTIFQGLATAFRKNKPMEDKIGSFNANGFSPISSPTIGNPIASIEDKQQQFLDWQIERISHDLYTRTMFYDTDRLTTYNDFRAMDQSPEISTALNVMRDECLAAETIIPLLNGEKKSIEELYNENYKDFWVYSFNPEKQIYEPAKSERVVFKGEQDVFRISFDDDSYIDATSEHLWLGKGENIYYKTSELKENQSIEPFYSRISNESDRIKGYEMIFEAGKWQYTHRIVKRAIYPNEKGVIHHKDFLTNKISKLNNEPSNLDIMNWFDHQKLHSSLMKERWEKDINFRENVIKKRTQKVVENWSNPEWKKNWIKKMSLLRKEQADKMTSIDKKKRFGRPGEKNPMFGNGIKISGNKNGRFLEELRHEFLEKDIIEAFINTSSIDEACLKLNTNRRILIKSEAYKNLNIQRWEDIAFIIENITINNIKLSCFGMSDKINLKRKLKTVCEENNWTIKQVKKFVKKQGYHGWEDFVDKINHKIKNVVLIGKKRTYDLVNVGEHHNFVVLTSNGTGVVSHNCLTRSEKGNVLEIYSENTRIKGILNDLFKNRLNVEYNLRLWIREMCKYGDFFLHLHLDKKLGIYNSQALPVDEIHREEGTTDDYGKVRFRWDTKNLFFDEFQIAHFRLIEDYKRLPYGRSILDSARKIWKQLQLSEDAMLVYRVTRAPERRIFYIEIGNLPDDDVTQHIHKMKNRMKKQPLVDTKTGNINYKYNPMNIEEDFFIPIRGDKASKIDTLPGAQNLDQIADIEYLQNKLFASIQVPKPYLNYTEAMGAGNLLAQSDLRFARTINTIQEAILMELRKIANVHLYILGFHDDIDNFTLSLTNPSTQQDLLKLESWKAKLEVFKEIFSSDATSPVSYTYAMQNILGFSKSDIKLILKQKKVEKKIFAEIESSSETYKNIGLFADLDKKFNKPGAENIDISAGSDQEAGAGAEAAAGGGGGFGGASFLGGETGGIGGETPGAETGGETADASTETGGETTGAEETPVEPIAERVRRKSIILKESIRQSDNRFSNYLDELFSEEFETTLLPEEQSDLLRSNDRVNEESKKLFETIERRIDDVEFENTALGKILIENNENFQTYETDLIANNNKMNFNTLKLIRSMGEKLDEASKIIEEENREDGETGENRLL